MELGLESMRCGMYDWNKTLQLLNISSLNMAYFSPYKNGNMGYRSFLFWTYIPKYTESRVCSKEVKMYNIRYSLVILHQLKLYTKRTPQTSANHPKANTQAQASKL